MHPSAANAVLKMLEEPPGDTCFVLASHQPERLPISLDLSRTHAITKTLAGSFQQVFQILDRDGIGNSAWFG